LKSRRQFNWNGEKWTGTAQESINAVWHIVKSWKRANAGHLPSEGGWLDQSAGFCDACDLIDGEIAEAKK